MLDTITLEAVLHAYHHHAYTLFDSGDYNLNLFGVRAAERRAGAWDDAIGCLYKIQGRWLLHVWPATTDAGTPWLTNPMAAGGTASLVPAQYRNVWQLGRHAGRIRALVQVRPVRVYRDNNRDTTHDLEPQTITEGVYGINLHPAWADPNPPEVGLWSAGCQVPRYVKDWQQLLALCEKSAKLYGNSFSYTLFDEADFATPNRTPAQ